MIRNSLRWLLAGIMVSITYGQTLMVVDRGPGASSPVPQPISRGAKGSYADSFRIGTKGQVWMIDAVRVWAIPHAKVQRVGLFGALDNPPVPGVPVCDCHALVPIAGNALVTQENGLWRLDFRDVRWSVPGDMDVLFSLRSTPEEADWSVAAYPAAKHRLHLLNEKGVPVGLEPLRRSPVAMPVQVWAHRTQ